MHKVVLDASAVLALLQGEPGGEQVLNHFEGSVIGTVNFAEAQATLLARGMDEAAALRAVRSCAREIIPFDMEQASSTAALLLRTHSLQLSLGDRACLALGMALKAPVYTADRAWAGLQLGIDIRVIR